MKRTVTQHATNIAIIITGIVVLVAIGYAAVQFLAPAVIAALD